MILIFFKHTHTYHTGVIQVCRWVGREQATWMPRYIFLRRKIVKGMASAGWKLISGFHCRLIYELLDRFQPPWNRDFKMGFWDIQVSRCKPFDEPTCHDSTQSRCLYCVNSTLCFSRTLRVIQRCIKKLTVRTLHVIQRCIKKFWTHTEAEPIWSSTPTEALNP